MVHPFLSIVIANYNYGRFLEEAIQSIVSQGMGNKVEIIICDAASTDNSVEIIKKYEKYISWWCSEPDGGQSAAFNKGFSHAKGRFLTWLNADDIFIPGSLKRVVDYIENHPCVEWISGGTVFCNGDMQIERMRIGASVPPMSKRYLPMHVIGGPSSFFSAQRLLEVGGVDEQLHYVMDIDLWHKFFAAGMKLVHLKLYVWGFRMHEASKTASSLIGSVSEGHRNEELAWRNTKAKLRYDPSRGERLLFIWKILTGSYLKSWYDTKRLKSLHYMSIGDCSYRMSVAMRSLKIDAIKGFAILCVVLFDILR